MTKFRLSNIFLCLVLMIQFGCNSRQVYQTSENAVSASTARVNINTATVDELEKLPHIGRKTAENIVQFRTENGPFRKPEHLMQIRGISESRYAEIIKYICTE